MVIMRIKLLGFLIFAIASSCHQDKDKNCDYIHNYYQFIYQAELAYEMGEYETAYQYYETGFETCTPINTATYNEIRKFAEICVRLGYLDKAIDFIHLDIQNGAELKWMLADSVLADAFGTERGTRLIVDYPKLREVFLNNINLDLRKLIIEMSHSDQQFRQGGYIQQKQDSIDILNCRKLIEIFESFGYPNETVIGGYNIDQMFVNVGTILLHTEDSIRMNYFVPKLTEFVRMGTCSPITLGTVIDQFYLYNGEPQRYGTYRGQGVRYATMIEDRNQVNKNRIGIGLPPLELNEKIDSLRQLKYPWARL